MNRKRLVWVFVIINLIILLVLAFLTNPVFHTKNSRPTCRYNSSRWRGPLKLDLRPVSNKEAIKRNHSDIKMGGHYAPKSCQSKDKVAILIPFRGHEENLWILLNNMLPMLKRQLLDFTVFVVEQDGKDPFNRAMLFNVGFKEATKRGNFDCVIFHDVNLVPEDERNLYNCTGQPRQMSVMVTPWNSQRDEVHPFGGVLSMKTKHFEWVNGYSNVFWGSGGEDQDLFLRITARGLRIIQPDKEIGRYKILGHMPSPSVSPTRLKFLSGSKHRQKLDGLSNLRYRVNKVNLKKLFTHISVPLIRPKGINKSEVYESIHV